MRGIFPDMDKARMKNRVSAYDYFLRLCEMCLACFKWNNLPDTCDERTIELSLLSTGKVLFFKDDTLSYLSLPFNSVGGFNCYGLPLERQAYSNYNSYTATRGTTDSVIIYNNKLRTNMTVNIIMYANRLYELDRTIDVNVNAQKTPILLIGDQKQQLALRNLYDKYAGNAPVIYADNQINKTEIKSIATTAPFVSPELYRLKVNIWNEVLTYMGVANITTDKKERMISDEVERGMGGVFINRNIRLKERQIACDKINKMFDLDISVEFDEEMTDKIKDDIEKEVYADE